MVPTVMPAIIAHPRLLLPIRLLRRVVSRLASDCPLCDEPAAGGLLCAGCAADIFHTMRTAPARCPRCALRLQTTAARCPDCAAAAPAYVRVIAAFDYEPPFDTLISRYKAERRYGLATALAQLLSSQIAHQASGLPQDLVLVPIPSSRSSLRQRGFNPAAELAAALAGCLQRPLRRGLLRRVREGPRQAAGSRRARRLGAVGLFDCTGPVPGHPIGLVDDVMTTGSTVDDASRALLRAGATEVLVLVAARTPMRRAVGAGASIARRVPFNASQTDCLPATLR